MLGILAQPLPDLERGRRVAEYWRDGQGWDWSRIQPYVSLSVMILIASEVIYDGDKDRLI